MKKLLNVSFFFLNAFNTFAHPISMYITASPISCNGYTYKIEVIEFGQKTSDILMSDELFFGDGASAALDLSTNGSVITEGFKSITKYTVEHSYPGPGIYTIAARFFNRTPDIKNMSNSVNTPFHVETTIILDPYLGCNSTPALELILRNQKMGSLYEFDISCLDAEGDSLSYELVTPLQWKDIPVVDYWLPYNYDSTLNKVTSKLVIDPCNGSLNLNSDYLSGSYTIAIKVNEWRKINNEYFKISSSILDYIIDYFDTENNPPQITGLQDTAIITDSKFKLQVIANDTDGDQLQLNAIGNFFHLENNTFIVDTNFYVGPVIKYIDFSPSKIQARASPYKAVFYAVDDNSQLGALHSYNSMYIWITDRAHEPDQIQFFTAQEPDAGLIELDWIDVDDELGYIIERSDKYFPKFHRLVVLPANAINYKDSSAVNGNTYHYRIKAVGTRMSPYKAVEISTTEIITSIGEAKNIQFFNIFPNPSDGTFWVTNYKDLKVFEIYDISGKVVWSKEYNFRASLSETICVTSGLSKGIYIINAHHKHGFLRKKLLIN